MASIPAKLAPNQAGDNPPASRAGFPAWWWQPLVLLAVLAYLYSSVISRLVWQWYHDPNFSHGFFVPLFSAYVVWTRRHKLTQIPLSPSWTGLLMIAAGLAVLIVGVFGAELFLSRSSLLLILGGMIVLFGGWPHLRALFFPWAFLIFMIPIPTIIMNQITLPLQFMASNMASTLLTWAGVPVLRDGNIIQLPNMSLEVVEACSGIRSLVSLCTLAVIYGYLLETSTVLRILLFVAAAPTAVFANALRIMGTGLMGLYWNPDKAEGFFHTFSGWVIFVLSLITLFIVHKLMAGIARWMKGSKP